MQITEARPIPAAVVGSTKRSSRIRAALLLILSALVILSSVLTCSWLAAFGLVPPIVDKSGRSVLNADYSPWSYGGPIININIPGLATAAQRGEGDWNTGNLPPPTATTAVQAAANPSPNEPPPTEQQPTATRQPVVVTKPPVTTPPPNTGGGGGTCGSPCTTSADCAGLACFGGVCWDAQVCEGGGSGGGNGGGSSGGGGGPPCTGICSTP